MNIFIFIYSSFTGILLHGYITNSQYDQLPVGLIAPLVEYRGHGFESRSSLNFFQAFLIFATSNCEDLSPIWSKIKTEGISIAVSLVPLEKIIFISSRRYNSLIFNFLLFELRPQSHALLTSCRPFTTFTAHRGHSRLWTSKDGKSGIRCYT